MVFLVADHLIAVGAEPSHIHYVDSASASGLTLKNTFGGRERKNYILETTGNGAAIFDFDGDGASDVFIANGTTLNHQPTRSQLYQNDGTGKFVDVAEHAGLTHSGWAQGACVADFDNDGHPDLFVTYYGHNILYRNRGDGTFEDFTEKAHLPVSGTRWGTGCAFTDIENDGFVDLFVSNYVELDLAKTPKSGGAQSCVWKGLPVMCGPTGLPMGHNALYRNNGDGTFTDISEKAGILKPGGRYGLGVIAADFDNDGFPDIYVACDQTPSLLYHNRGNGTFEERGSEAGVAYNFDGRSQSGMGVAVADYDGNGFLDIVKTNFSGDLPSLYNNEDGKFFTDVSRQAGIGKRQLLGWGVLFLDADEDGWPDIFIANGHVYPEVDRTPVGDRYRQQTELYRSLGNGKFTDVSLASGPAFSELRPARGMASGDLDGDGHPEIVIVNMNEPPSLLKNEASHQNAVVVSLTGTKSNRSAIGARVTIESKTHSQMQEVMSGGSYLSQNDLALCFGLAAATHIERLSIHWPSGLKQEWKNLDVNQKFAITEGALTFKTTQLLRRSVASN